MAVDSAALLAAAVKAACLAGAPRRTVQAVASAVTGVLVRPAGAVLHTDLRMPAGTQCRAEGDDDPAQLLSALRSVRKAQRQRKKERRRAAKQAANQNLGTSTPFMAAAHAQDHMEVDVDAGQHSGLREASVAEPAAASMSRAPSDVGDRSNREMSRVSSQADDIRSLSLAPSSLDREPHATSRIPLDTLLNESTGLHRDTVGRAAGASAGSSRSPRRHVKATKGRGPGYKGHRSGKGASVEP